MRASIKQKFDYIYRNCYCFFVIAQLFYYRNQWENLDTKRLLLLCFVIFSVPFAHFICGTICVIPLTDQISTYEYIKKSISGF